MSTFRSAAADLVVRLGADNLVGRTHSADWSLEGSDVSAYHARVCWTVDEWTLQDLGSRNGTRLDGRRLEPGETTSLRQASRVEFGVLSGAWLLVDGQAPRAFVRCEATSRTVVDRGGLIALPDEEAPFLTVLKQAPGRWQLEKEGEVSLLEDRDTFGFEGQTWRFRANARPDSTLVTNASVARSSAIEDAMLKVETARGGEVLEVHVQRENRWVRVSPRSHHRVLLSLARRRRSETGQQGAGRGWVVTTELHRELEMDARQLNLAVHRLRRQFAELGFENAGGLVERRPSTGELRLGGARVELKET